MFVRTGTDVVGCYKFPINPPVQTQENEPNSGLIQKVKVYFNCYHYRPGFNGTGNHLLITLDPSQKDGKGFVKTRSLSKYVDYHSKYAHSGEIKYHLGINGENARAVVDLLYKSNDIPDDLYHKIQPALDTLESALRSPMAYMGEINEQQVSLIKEYVEPIINRINGAAASQVIVSEWIFQATEQAREKFGNGGQKNLEVFFAKQFPTYMTPELINDLIAIRRLATGTANLENSLAANGGSVPHLRYQERIVKSMINEYFDPGQPKKRGLEGK